MNLGTIKLINVGVVGKLARLIHDYLSSRVIRIQTDDTVSPQFNCELGLPQASILSPLLFIIVRIDIVSDPTLTHYIFADDTTLLVESNTASDSLLKASEPIKQVTKWCFRNRIMINVSKRKIGTSSKFHPSSASSHQLLQREIGTSSKFHPQGHEGSQRKTGCHGNRNWRCQRNHHDRNKKKLAE